MSSVLTIVQPSWENVSSTVLADVTSRLNALVRTLAWPLITLLGATLLLWFVLSQAPPLHLELGQTSSDRFISGFYPPEQGDYYRFRWSGPEARLQLHGASAEPGVLTLLIHGDQLSAQTDPTLSLVQHDQALARFAVQPGWRRYAVLLPAGSLANATSATRPLELRSAMVRPGRQNEDVDLRPLGVPLAEITQRALAPSQTPALIRALWLSWLLAVLAGSLAWIGTLIRSYGRATQSWLQPRWLASSTILLGTGLLALWAWRDPASLAWALPPMPWILGTGTMLLVVLGRTIAPIPHPAPPTSHPATRVAGLALLGLATGLLATQQLVLVGSGMGLALIALVLLSWGPQGLGARLWDQPHHDLSQRQAFMLLGVIFGLALGLRLFRLDELPFGLWRDEARHGWFAQLIRDFPNYRPIYLASDRVNMPALGIYPFAVALWLWGEQIWAMRLVTGVAGALTVFPLYALATMLSGQRRVGVLVAFFLAASSWHLAVGRLAFPTIFDPLLTLSGLSLLLIALRPSSMQVGSSSRPPIRPGWRLLAALGAGVCIGLAVQTYHTGRVAPLVAAWMGLLLLGQDWRAWRSWFGYGLVALLALLLTLSPLLYYALNQPAAFNDRVNAVFLLSPAALRAQAPLAALDEAVGLHLGMFHVSGDQNGRHHAPGRPLLDYLSGLGLLLGVAALLRRPLEWRSLFLGGAVVISLLPGLLSVNAPHGLRAFAALAFVCIITALGWVALWDQIRLQLPNMGATLRQATAIVMLSMVVVLNSMVYFVIMPPQREAFLVFYPVQSQMGIYVRELANQGALPPQIFVPAGLPEDPVFAFLASDLPITTFAGDQLSAPAQPGAIFLLSGYFAEEERAGLTKALGAEPHLHGLGPMFPDGSMRTFYVYTR